MNKAPQTLKGFRDFLPKEKRQRDVVAKKIRDTFELFGFEPLETPTLEYADLLLGKYGEEADKLVYTFTDRGGREVGLRYDQTVPTARVLAQYQNDLPKMFRRYQMQNVFRGDNPQKGRSREFTQCDIDIFGTKSEIADAEVLAATYLAYKTIGFSGIKILINSREVLSRALEPFASEKISINSIIQTIDKMDKKSEEEILDELSRKGSSEPKSILESVRNVQMDDNLAEVVRLAISLGVPQEALEFSPYIARGLDYYTGMIFEVKILGYDSGSVGGGGRYDRLIKDLSGMDIPAVGMAFGFDRTVEAASELGLVNESDRFQNSVLVSLFSEELLPKSIDALNALRMANISSEIYPEVDKIGKQIKYADQKGIGFVVIIGEEEAGQGKATLKNLSTGEEKLLPLDELVKNINN